MVFSIAGCTGSQPGETVIEPGVTEEPPAEGWTLPEVNWGDGLFDGKTLIDDHFEEDENFSWGTYSNGGTFTLYTENGEMVADIENPGTLDYSCQLYRDDFELNQDGVYEVSFTIRSDIERAMQWRFQLNGGDYHAYYLEIVEFGTENQHYEYTFTMNETTDPAPRFCFNIGMVDSFTADPGPHNVFFDNFELTLIDATNKVAGSGQIEMPAIAVNQIGYLPGAFKSATVRESALNQTVKLINEDTKETVLEVEIGAGVCLLDNYFSKCW